MKIVEHGLLAKEYRCDFCKCLFDYYPADIKKELRQKGEAKEGKNVFISLCATKSKITFFM